MGLEYTTTDMSLSALYLHELHHRMTSFRSRNVNPGTGPGGDLPRRASLSELDEENLAQGDQESGATANRLASSTVA